MLKKYINKKRTNYQAISSGITRYLSLELLDDVLEEVLIKVLSSQEGVPIGRLHLKHALLDLQDRDIEGAAAQIVHSNTGGGRNILVRSQERQTAQ